MKTKFIASTLIALAAVATTSAFAADTYYESEAEAAAFAAPVVSKVSRQEVQAEFFKAQKNGTIAVVTHNGEESAIKAATAVAPSDLKRDTVRIETAAWNKTRPASFIDTM